jgi:carbonic anhydrase
MSSINEAIKANERYSDSFQLGNLPVPPARKLAVVACMDARLMPDQILGFKTGDAHVIRNAGGIVTDDVIRSLIISHHLLGTEEFVIINHTDCGMLTFEDEHLRSTLEEQTGAAPAEPAHFHTFTDLEANVREQVQRVKSHPWIPDSIPVRGFIYDVKTGRLSEVPATAGSTYPSYQQQSATS